MNDEFVTTRDIRKRFAGVEALRGVSMAIRRGEIRCLAGENGSGKSTLIKILAGVHEPDGGEIQIDGRRYRHLRPIDASRVGIQVIYQDFALFPNLTVAENIALNAQLARGRRFVNWRQVYCVAREATEQIGFQTDLSRLVAELSVGDRQLVAISRALVQKARLVIMDEPTSALTQKEVQALFTIIRRLQAERISVLFVSHKLEEVLDISETITILQNGRKVAEGDVTQFDRRQLFHHMTGRELRRTRFRFEAGTPPSPPLLRLEHLSRRGAFEDVNLRLAPGEIVGLSGLLGSGRTDLALALFGLEPAKAGRVILDDQPVRIRRVQDATQRGIAYVPEDRLTEGLFLEQSIDRNLAVGVLGQLRSRLGLVDRKKLAACVGHWIDALRIQTPSGRLPARSLSGGNQQKLVLGRWLATEARLLILNRPTVGVDVGSKMDIHLRIGALARQGLGVILISDELPELLEMCNRIYLMHRGRIVGELESERCDEATLSQRLGKLD